MQYLFYKYQGTGNDFIIFDNRESKHDFFTEKVIKRLCDRKFGIGADGLMFLNKSEKFDFKMRYFNADGKEGTMCGNGGRSIVAFAKKLNIITTATIFEAIDGIHNAKISNKNIVNLKMNDVSNIEKFNSDFILDTGSPHYIKFVNNIDNINVFEEGRKIRYSKKFQNGINVNFVEILNSNEIKVRTYERGVENETLSCGTGVTAASIASFIKNKNTKFHIQTKGGSLETTFKTNNNKFENIWLKGSAEFVFEGSMII